MFNKIKVRLLLAWVVLRSKSVHVIFQQDHGLDPRVIGIGQSDLKDLVLISTEIKRMYDSFMDMINEVAAETGDLHALQQLRDAVQVIEKEQGNGGN